LPDRTDVTEQQHGDAQHHVQGERRVVAEGVVGVLPAPAAAPPPAAVVHVEQVFHGDCTARAVNTSRWSVFVTRP
jgi:hypothetical protein